MSENSEMQLKEYLAGASVSVGFVLVTILILINYYPYISSSAPAMQEPIFLIYYIIVHAIGGVLGGYIVGVRNVERAIWFAAHTGALAFIIESVSFYLLGWSIAGDLWSLSCLVGGGICGGLLAKKRL